MSQSIRIDEKGRLILPKSLRKAAGVHAPGVLVATVKGEGRIELVAVDAAMSLAKEVARRKLAGWREEEHEAEKLAMKIVSKAKGVDVVRIRSRKTAAEVVAEERERL